MFVRKEKSEICGFLFPQKIMILLLSEVMAGQIQLSCLVQSSYQEMIFIFNCVYPKIIIFRTESFRICCEPPNQNYGVLRSFGLISEQFLGDQNILKLHNFWLLKGLISISPLSVYGFYAYHTSGKF